jgi:hypothetical protein
VSLTRRPAPRKGASVGTTNLRHVTFLPKLPSGIPPGTMHGISPSRSTSAKVELNGDRGGATAVIVEARCRVLGAGARRKAFRSVGGAQR